MPTPEQWAEAVKNARDPLPMEAEIWAAGADPETAHFVARMLGEQGYYLVNPDNLGWPDIHRYHAELRKGQSVYEDAGGYMLRAIMALLGKKPDPVVSYRDAARAMLDGADLRN
jgi:hypothetical protein